MQTRLRMEREGELDGEEHQLAQVASQNLVCQLMCWKEQVWNQNT
jgi:hypothetical protein